MKNVKIVAQSDKEKQRLFLMSLNDIAVVEDKNLEDGVVICSFNLLEMHSVIKRKNTVVKFSKHLPNNTVLCNKFTVNRYL